MGKRIEWIDIAKGLGIFLVAFGHFALTGAGKSTLFPVLSSLIVIIYLFHMPLFYFIGGLTFHARQPFNLFLSKKVKTLLVPYYIFSIYYIAKPLALLIFPSLTSTLRIPIQNQRDLLGEIVRVLTGDGLWFFMAYFWGELIAYAIVKVCRDRIAFIRAIGLIIIFGQPLISVVWNGDSIPFKIWRGILIAGYLCFVYTIADLLKQLTAQKASIIGIFSLILLGLSSFTIINGNLSMIKWFLGTVAALSGSLLFVCISIMIARFPALAYIGKYSSAYYAVNVFTMNIVKIIVLKLLHIDASTWLFMGQFIVVFIATIAGLLLSTIENLIIEKWLWWSVGKPRPERVKHISKQYIE